VSDSAGNAHQGLRLTSDDPTGLRDGLAAVVDYRGDVTITLADGGTVVGYIFDCSERDRPQLSVMPSDGGAPARVSVDDIAAIDVTGRDTAAGKSFESWIRRYVEKKLAGEAANIESEPI
jgi:hypothetical protein